MHFETEAELQEFIHDYTGGEREVWLNASNRIDILTEGYAIEVKSTLTPAAIDKAAGQLFRYRKYVGGRQLVIAGMSPTPIDASLQTSSTATTIQALLSRWAIRWTNLSTIGMHTAMIQITGPSMSQPTFIQIAMTSITVRDCFRSF